MRKLVVAAAAALLIGAPAIARADLIVNGGFETGDFTGWSVAAGATFVTTAGFDGLSPHSGTYFAALGNVGCCGTLSQTFSDTAGTTLNVSLWLASDGATPNHFDVQLDGITLFTQDNIPAQGYFNITGSGLATGSDTLTIHERNDPAYLALDDVSVTVGTAVVPEPSSLALLASGLAAFGWFRRRRNSA